MAAWAVPLAAAEEDVLGVAAVAAAVNLDTTLVRARFSDFNLSFSAFSFCICCCFFCGKINRVQLLLMRAVMNEKKK